jgi:hypothetical protein
VPYVALLKLNAGIRQYSPSWLCDTSEPVATAFQTPMMTDDTVLIVRDDDERIHSDLAIDR